MNSKLALAVTIIAVMGVAFAGIGYSYTATTENSGNTLTSEYAVLEQHNYTYGNEEIRFNTITTSAGSVYKLTKTSNSNPVDTVCTIGGTTYKGIQIGTSDTLKATKVGNDTGSLKVHVMTFGPGFKDFSSAGANGWKYILKVTKSTGTESVADQYAIYDGSAVDRVTNISEWSYYVDDSGTLVSADSLTLNTYNDTTQYTYTTTLYLVGPNGQSTVRPDTGGYVINNGTIKFMYDSEEDELDES